MQSQSDPCGCCRTCCRYCGARRLSVCAALPSTTGKDIHASAPMEEDEDDGENINYETKEEECAMVDSEGERKRRGRSAPK